MEEILFRLSIPFLKILPACILLFLVYLDVSQKSVSLTTFFLWIGAMILAAYFLKNQEKIKLPKFPFSVEILILVFVTISSLFFFATRPFHFHYDEYITAYISYSLPSITKINWFGAVPEKGEWINQFPILFHLFQKPFFVFGPNKLTVQISTFPYTLGIVIFLYLFCKRMFSKKFAFLASLTFIFLGPQLYLGSLGLHFHSSAFFFISSLYFFIKVYQTKNFIYSIFLGVSMAASYLSYGSSYITAPLIILFMLLSFFKEENKKGLFIAYIKVLIIFFICLFPFLVYALRIDNFFLQRIGEVNIFTGTWKAKEDTFQDFSSFFRIITQQFIRSLRSLFLPNIGGAGEYWFGHLSFFEPFGAFLFILGLISFFCELMKKFKIGLIIILLSTLGIFFLGMVFTIHPPPFHRISIAYPLLGILIARGLERVAFIFKKFRFKRNSLIVGILLFLYAASNVNNTLKMIKKDYQINSNDIIYATEYIAKNIPRRTPIFIVAFPSNAFGKELFFRLRNSYPINTNYFETLRLPTADTLLLIIHRPNPEIIKTVLNRFPKANLVSKPKLRDYLLINIP